MGQVLLGGRKRMYGTLPEQVSSFYAARGNAQVTLTWSNPSAEYAGTLIVRKTGSYSQRPSDGIKIYKGTGTHYTDTGLTNGTQYDYRAFAYNSRGEYQTISRIATATPVSEIPIGDLPIASAIKLKYKGSTTKFIVIHKGNPDTNIYDPSCNDVWMLSNDCLYMSAWNNTDYAKSGPCTYNNTTLINDFSPYLQGKIKQVKIPYSMVNLAYEITLHTLSNGLSCKIFDLSSTELGIGNGRSGKNSAKLDYFISGITADALQRRIAQYNGTNSEYWTRDQYETSVNTVDASGKLGTAGFNGDSRFCRPAFILPASAVVYTAQDSEGCYTLIEE